MSQDETDARMAELADAPDSKSGSRKRVGVRPSLWAPIVLQSQTQLTTPCQVALMQRSVAKNLSEVGINWVVPVTTTPYSGCHGGKPLDMMWGLAYSSPEFAVEYL